MNNWCEYFIRNMEVFYDELNNQIDIDLYFYIQRFLDRISVSEDNKQSFILVDDFIDNLDFDSTIHHKLLNHIFMILSVITKMGIQYGKFSLVLKIKNIIKDFDNTLPYKMFENKHIEDINYLIEEYIETQVDNFV